MAFFILSYLISGLESLDYYWLTLFHKYSNPGISDSENNMKTKTDIFTSNNLLNDEYFKIIGPLFFKKSIII